jgi:DNA-binding transcriptional MerR regulator
MFTPHALGGARRWYAKCNVSRGNITMNRLTVGRMAELNCVSARTLRVYDQKGLLVPAERDEETGYRYYTLDQCATLDAIQQLQHLDMSLDEIKRVLDAHDVRSLCQNLCEREEGLDAQMRELMRTKHQLNNLKSRCFIAMDDVPLGEYRVEIIEERRAVRIDLGDDSLQADLDSDESLERWQLAVCKVKQMLLQQGIPAAYFGNVACSIPCEQLEAGVLNYTQALVFIDQTDFPLDGKSEVIPAGRYLTVYCKDLSSDEGELRESMQLKDMLSYMKEHGYEIGGDYIGEVVLDTELFGYSGRDELVKMQIRIK